MIYTLLDVAMGPSIQEMVYSGIGIMVVVCIGLAAIIGLTAYFIKKNEKNKSAEKNNNEDT